MLLPIRTVGLHALRLTAPRRRVKGVELVDLTASDAAPLFFARVADALALVEQRAPAILGGISRRLKRIALLKGGGEFYHRGLGAYVVDLPTLKQRSVPELALAIVHEATHARIEGLGIRYRPSRRDRIERICLRAEMTLAEKLPANEDMLRGIREKVSTKWWTEDSLHERRVEQLSAHGTPTWVTRMYDRFFSP
ncbi:MAG: hypothetical protein ACREMW_15450 [Gemmatimonadales bacterium]